MKILNFNQEDGEEMICSPNNDKSKYMQWPKSEQSHSDFFSRETAPNG